MLRWVSNVDERATRLLWVYGPPGAGKSSCITSLVREFEDAHILYGKMFFDRQISASTNANAIFPTVACQLADARCPPAVAQTIEGALVSNPSIANGLTSLQVEELFVRPLQIAAETDSTQPLVVVFDALDECERMKVKDVARHLSSAVKALPANVKIIISSRTDVEITTPFNALLTKNLAHSIHLDTSSPASAHDVALMRCARYWLTTMTITARTRMRSYLRIGQGKYR